MLEYLGDKIKNEIFSFTNYDNLTEIRVRAAKGVFISYFDNYRKLSENRLTYIPDIADVEKIVLRLCNFSVFCAEESIKQGYITSNDGERVGICGKCVIGVGGKVQTIKDISSLVIRIPKQIKGFLQSFFDKYYTDSIKSCLVVSPPFGGKTTFIRELGRLISDEKKTDVLFVDERDELSASGKFDLGKNSDIMRYCDKRFGFYNGVRALNPKVIVCDELMDDNDVKGVIFAAASGVKTIATIHGNNLKDLQNKSEFNEIIKSGIFDIILELKDFIPKKVYIFDGGKIIC